MNESRYTGEAVKELLDWAKNMIESKSYPDSPYQLSKEVTILNCEHFLNSMIATISRTWENPTFHAHINQLWTLNQ